MADSKSGTGGSVSCPRCQKNVNPYKLGGAHDCTPSLAGTAETMEPENGEWLARRLAERCKCRPLMNECCDWCQGAAMVRRVCAALAERTAECERLKVREREALDANAASFGALRDISLLTALGGEVDEYSDVVKSVESALATAQEENAKMRDALERIANADYRGNRPSECTTAYNVLAGLRDAARPPATPEGE